MFPLAVSIGVIVALRILSPTVYHYMIDVPRAFGLDARRTGRMAWDLLLDSPLFVVLVTECLLLDPQAARSDPRVRWLLAVLVVAVPYSALTAGKVGGWCNSLLPALLAMMAFCILRLPRLLKGLGNLESPLPVRMALGGFIALLLLMNTFPHMTKFNTFLVARTACDREYASALERIGTLPGKVVCPEDPTIPLYAKGYLGQSIFAERDTHLVRGSLAERGAGASRGGLPRRGLRGRHLRLLGQPAVRRGPPGPRLRAGAGDGAGARVLPDLAPQVDGSGIDGATHRAR